MTGLTREQLDALTAWVDANIALSLAETTSAHFHAATYERYARAEMERAILVEHRK